MNGLVTHLACLEELERDRRRQSAQRRASALPAIVSLTATALGIAGFWFLETLARERLGLP